jgi:hypothetical protein
MGAVLLCVRTIREGRRPSHGAGRAMSRVRHGESAGGMSSGGMLDNRGAIGVVEVHRRLLRLCGQTKKEAKKRSEAAARHDGSASADRLRVGRTLFGGACALTSGSWYASPVVVFHRSTVSAARVSAVTIGRHEWPVLPHGTTWFTINVALFPRVAGCRPRSFQEPGNEIREQWVLCSEWHMIPRCHPRSNECAMNAPSLSRIRKCCERTVAAAVHARSRRSLNARHTWYCASSVMAMLYVESHMAK